MKLRLRIALALAACAVFGAAEPAPPALDLNALLAQFSGTTGIVTEFRERKFLRLLGEPLESQGTLYYQPPDRLARITSAPARTKLVLDGDRMRYSDEAGSSEVSLADRPVARVFAENMVAIFRGDRAELESLYRLEFHAEGERWQLALTPKGAPLDRAIASIQLSGTGRMLRQLDVVERDGDSTQTVFEKSDPDHLFEAHESLAVFGPKGSAP
jgi:outer membrane lipoprotein-sorting protein